MSVKQPNLPTCKCWTKWVVLQISCSSELVVVCIIIVLLDITIHITCVCVSVCVCVCCLNSECGGILLYYYYFYNHSWVNLVVRENVRKTAEFANM